MPSTIVHPVFLLLAAIALTAWACAASQVLQIRCRRRLANLAREWQMQYSPRDVFNLAGRIAPRLPVPGAADVRVRDLIYGTEPQGYRCVFLAEFTSGVVRGRARHQCVVSVLESRDQTDSAEIWSSFRIAPSDLPLLEQYRSLKQESEQ